jgi:hypothetical protein
VCATPNHTAHVQHKIDARRDHTSKCSPPRNPQRKPAPSALVEQGVTRTLASFNVSRDIAACARTRVSKHQHNTVTCSCSSSSACSGKTAANSIGCGCLNLCDRAASQYAQWREIARHAHPGRLTATRGRRAATAAPSTIVSPARACAVPDADHTRTHAHAHTSHYKQDQTSRVSRTPAITYPTMPARSSGVARAVGLRMPHDTTVYSFSLLANRI